MMPRQFIQKFVTTLVLLYSLIGAGAHASAFENTGLGASNSNEAIASESIGFGLRYLYGSGVERDHVRALMWFKLALAAEQPDAAKYHDLVALRMTPLQIARAQAFAEICADSNYTECD
jgi:TPR repeat protein